MTTPTSSDRPPTGAAAERPGAAVASAVRRAPAPEPAAPPKTFSFELFPPRTPEIAARMHSIIDRLAAAGPEFISVTFGAGGSSRDKSLDLLDYIEHRTPTTAMAHLTCVGSSYAEANALVREFLDRGITHFLALRGDPPKGAASGEEFLGDLRTASELVQLIHFVQQEREPQRPLDIGGADGAAGAGHDRWVLGRGRQATVCVATYPNGHPQSRGIEQDYDVLLAKEAAGANLAITQLFFHADDYLRFVEGARAHGVTMDILPGILPVTSSARLHRMAELAEEPVPVGLDRSLARARSEGARREIGVAHAAALSFDLLEGGAPGIHLYTQNRIVDPLEVLARVGLVSRSVVEADAAKAAAGSAVTAPVLTVVGEAGAGAGPGAGLASGAGTRVGSASTARMPRAADAVAVRPLPPAVATVVA